MVRNKLFYGIATILAFAMIALGFEGCQGPKTNKNQETSVIDQKADSIISTMTLAEKIGQMTQVTLAVVSKGPVMNPDQPQQIDMAKLKEAILKYHVGSILNVVAHAYTRKHWYEIQKQIKEVDVDISVQTVPPISVYECQAFRSISATYFGSNGASIPVLTVSL